MQATKLYLAWLEIHEKSLCGVFRRLTSVMDIVIMAIPNKISLPSPLVGKVYHLMTRFLHKISLYPQL